MWISLDMFGAQAYGRIVELASGSRRCARWSLAAALMPWGLASAQTVPPAPLSYNEAEARLGDVSDAVLAASAGTASKRDLADAARHLRIPDVTLDVKQLKFQKSLDIPLGPLSGLAESAGLPGTINYFDQGWHLRPTASIVLPLYTGGKIPAAQRAAAAAVSQAEAEEEGARQSETVQLVQVYFGQQLAAHVVDVRRQVRDGLQRHYLDAEALEHAGMATKAQRLQAAVARDQAEREYQQSLNDRSTLGATLSQLLRAGQPVETTTPLFVLSTPMNDVARFRQSAKDRHPQLLRLRALVEQAEQGVKLKEAELKPQVFLFGQRDLKRSDALLTDPDWVFGIGFKYSFLSSSDRPKQISAARNQLEQARSSLKELENEIDIAVTRAVNTLDSSRQQFLLLDSSIDQAEENLRLQELSFKEGQANSLDVIDARLRLGSVAAERARAAYQYDVALAQLLEVAGQTDQFSTYIQKADRVFTP